MKGSFRRAANLGRSGGSPLRGMKSSSHRPRQGVGCGFSKETFARTRGNDEVAPVADLCAT